MPDLPAPPDRWPRLWEVFHAALDLPAGARERYLEEVCAHEPGLRQEVAELLAAHAAAGVLDRPVMAPPPGRVTLEAGVLLAGRFRIVRLIGSGGMGTVYRAVDEALGETVAVKVVHADAAPLAGALERFRREVVLARRVTHPNACRVYELFEHVDAAGATVFLTMEFVEGETLSERLARDGPFDTAEAYPIVAQVASALAAAHRVGVVHRDLKSANVVLVPQGGDGDGARAVVTDFGLAALSTGTGVDAARLTRSGDLLGTPAFMAPEQLEGRAVTPATDIYALGLVAYEMVTGAVPFAGESPLTLAVRRVRDRPPPPGRARPGLPADWDAAILRCLERDPADRFRTADALVSALRPGRPTNRTSRVSRWWVGSVRPRLFVPRRLRRRAIAVVAGLTAILVLGSGALRSRSDPVAGAAAALLDFGERDWVLVAEVENRTGESVLDGTVGFALERELHASPFVNVVPRVRVADTLRLMKRAEDTVLEADVAREVALRDGGIRALVRGRIDRLGDRYVVAVELVATASGVVVASLAEEASDQRGILAATRALSNRLRATVGEELPSVEPAEALALVTTSSLRALQLYSRAEALITHRRADASAEELLREAIAEDPEFASAHMQLAHAVRNQGRLEEAMAHATRAMALASTTGEAERHFIRGGYHSMTGDFERAVASYLALLELHPDHFWGTYDVAMTLSFGRLRGADAVPYFRRAADLRPNDFVVNRTAAWNIAVRGNALPEARTAIDRAQRLLTPDLVRQHGSAAVWVELVPVYERWLADDVRGALEQVDRLRRDVPGHTSGERLAYQLMQAYETLGRLDDAHDLLKPPVLTPVGLVIAFLRDDTGTLSQWRSLRSLEPPVRESLGAVGPIVLARLGRPDLARTARPRGRTDRSVASIAFRDAFAGAASIVDGEIALAEGRLDEAVRLFEKGLPAERLTGSAVYFLGCESLAFAHLQRGEADRAIAVLEEALRQRGRTVQGSGAFWLRTTWQLREVYRETGRVRDTARLDDDLRRLLAVADENHPIVVGLASRHIDPGTP